MHLSKINAHPRDKDIQFFEEGHNYIIYNNPNVKYTSTTTWVHSYFEKFDADKIIEKMMNGKSWKEGHKYWNMTSQQIKDSWNKNSSEVSNAGTKMHYDIECFMNNSNLNMSIYSHKELYDNYFDQNMDASCIPFDSSNNVPKEWQYFINFVRDFPDMVPYRTEWTIFHEELKISGSVDMVYEKSDGTLAIYDWKRCKDISKINNFNKFATVAPICHLPDSNFWHYALQLNIYRYILQEKYNKTVSELCLVRLHPDTNENNYELIPVPMLDQEINDIVALRMCTLQF
jgi:ATP-dependent exoDNAse (exonuclease V) beta subunit